MSLLLDVALFLRATSKTLKLTSTQKVVLFTLASRIGENENTWIKQDQLSEECQISRRQLIRDIKHLIGLKLVHTGKNKTKKGQQNNYGLNALVLKNVTSMSPTKDDTMCHERHIDPPTIGHPCHIPTGHPCHIPPAENVVQLVDFKKDSDEKISAKGTIENNNKANIQKQTNRSTRFEEFWSVYLRKEDKIKAKKKWETMKCDEEADEIINHLKIRNATVWLNKEKQFILLPTTFLNNKRWKDELEMTTHENNRPAHELNRRAASVKRVMDSIWSH